MNPLDAIRYNARVLDEHTPPGCFEVQKSSLAREEHLFPEKNLYMAFSEETQGLLEAFGLDFTPGAGGWICPLNAESLSRMEQSSHEEAENFCKAVRSAYAGWARKDSLWCIQGGKNLNLGHGPKLMGVVNVTPDSFSDGGLFYSKEAALQQARDLFAAGADILDVGGESTRPGSEPVSSSEEMDRTVPLIEAVSKETGAILSIDTTKAKVAEAALHKGASIINDISGLTFDPDMAPLAAQTGAGVVIMHIQGTPRDMQKNPVYGDTLAEICRALREKVYHALEAGIEAERIVLDPGIGFGKRFEDNLRILSGLGELRSLGFPLLLGCSRKSFLGRITGREAPQRDLETTATSVIAALGGVSLLRVHDVAQNLLCLKVVEKILQERRFISGPK